MTLVPGTRLGPYEVVAPLGAGGMGEVWRARDPRLARDVAIKALPAAFAQDAERLARFEREAKLLASLNHPNVAGIHGVEEADGTRYLVLEFVDGETLDAHLQRGRLPLAEVLDIAKQVAAGVEAAHEAGVVHRDLKPGNVMLTASGGVKVLDFGLAKSGANSGAASSDPKLSASPTMTYHATEAGMILGTAAYMSPEQARGKAVDRRTDIWSFGCVLYEMLAGKRAYDGETVSDMVARILEREPDWSALPAATPPRLVALLKRCLVKDAKQRQRDLGDVRLELETIAAGDGGAAVAAPAAGTPRAAGAWRTIAFAAAGVALAALALLVWRGRATAPAPSFEFTLVPPAGCTFAQPADPVLSRDGRLVACSVVDSQGVAHIAVRDLAREDFRVLPQTEGGMLPFWSPDGKSVAYFSESGGLRVLKLDGSDPVLLAEAADGRGGSWGTDGTIVYAPTPGGAIYRRSAAGGDAVQVTRLDPGRHEVAHRYPVLLEDGKHFTYIAIASSGGRHLCVGDVAGGPARVVGQGESYLVGAGRGWVASVADRTLRVRRFDARGARFVGEWRTLGPCGAWRKLGDANITADAHGKIVYQAPIQFVSRLRAFDLRTGALGPVLREFDTVSEACLAPDGRRLAYASGHDGDLWIGDAAGGAPTRATFHHVTQYLALYALAWSPDSRRVGYALELPGTADVIHTYDVASATDTAVFAAPGLFASPVGWTADGAAMLAFVTDSLGQFDPWRVPADGSGGAAPLAHTPEYERDGQVSPDGRWLAAIVSVEGRTEARVLSVDRPGVRYQVSLPEPILSQVRWAADGRALYFAGASGNVLEVPVSFAGGFTQGDARRLARTPANVSVPVQFVTGGRFLVFEIVRSDNPAPLRVLTSWPARLEEK